MIILSYNCRGLVSQPKKIVLRELMKSHNPDVLLLQETMGQGEEVNGILSRMFHGWVFQALDAHGRSGGLSMGIKSAKMKEFSSWGSENSLALEVYSKKICHPLLLLNVYGPCMERAVPG